LCGWGGCTPISSPDTFAGEPAATPSVARLAPF
jgi:hypothetical protein